MPKIPFVVLVSVLLLVVIGGLYAYYRGAANPEGGQPTLKGNIIFGVTDAAANLDSVQSVQATITKVQVHQQGNGWITVSEGLREFNLLDLKTRNAVELLAQAELPAGEYDQIRLEVSRVLITKTNGQVQEAKLPSGDLKLIGKLIVQGSKTSSVVIDFLVEESLHMTGSGRYIFAPVVKLETRSNATVQVSGKDVQVAGGTIETEANLGMDENGQVKEGFALNARSSLELVGDILRIIPEGQSEAGVSVSAQAASDIAKEGNHVDTALSVTLERIDGKKVWQVSGIKGLILEKVFVDAATGTVIATE